MHVPPVRIRACNPLPERPERDYVLYWMIAARRTTWSFGLQRAVERARAHRRPLLVLEALRCDYPWASDRLHRFVLQGMADNARRLARAGIHYYPYVESKPGAGRGLLARLASRATLVVTDEFPAFFLPRMVTAAARQVDVRLEAIDSNGLLPLRAADREFKTAASFRRFLQKSLRPHLQAFPDSDPLRGARRTGSIELPATVERRWPRADAATLHAGRDILAMLPIDHDVAPIELPGGSSAAASALDSFLEALPRYADEHPAPAADVTSRLSPYLHFGHIGAHGVVAAVLEREGWTPGDLAPRASGGRQGWWGVSRAAEAFLDELVTWRELGFNVCHTRADYDRWSSLPEWAQATLGAHAGDPRPHVYTRAAFERAATHDPLWNAAQEQLRREGRIHNTMRMLWGKKIVEWTRRPRQALSIMIELNNRWAVDGRDPNSYTGILWVLGRHDRPWGPERPIFGTVRWMSSANAARKFRMGAYLQKYGREPRSRRAERRYRENRATKARRPNASSRASKPRSTGASA